MAVLGRKPNKLSTCFYVWPGLDPWHCMVPQAPPLGIEPEVAPEQCM